MTRHEVQILRAVGMAQVAVASKSGVAVQSVRRIERDAPMTTSGEKSLVRRRRGGGASIAPAWTAAIARWLTEDCGLEKEETVQPIRAGRGDEAARRAAYAC